MPDLEITEGIADLRRRVHIGERCAAIAEDGPWSALDRPADLETAARDAVSDILSALFGPAGYSVETVGRNAPHVSEWDVVLRAPAIANARAFLAAALESYAGDAEDYTAEPVQREQWPEGWHAADTLHPFDCTAGDLHDLEGDADDA